jgi:hypothetical protein
MVALPEPTLPIRGMDFVLKRMASARLVFPVVPCPMSAMFRILSVG